MRAGAHAVDVERERRGRVGDGQLDAEREELGVGGKLRERRVRERLRLVQEHRAPVGAAEFAEDARGGARRVVGGGELAGGGHAAHVAPKAVHELADDRVQVVLEVVLVQVVRAQLDGAHALRDHVLRARERRDHWAQQQRQVRQQVAQAHGQRDAQLHEDLL